MIAAHLNLLQQVHDLLRCMLLLHAICQSHIWLRDRWKRRQRLAFT
jgi:hypothetical protein